MLFVYVVYVTSTFLGLFTLFLSLAVINIRAQIIVYVFLKSLLENSSHGLMAHPGCSPIVIDNVPLNGPTLNILDAEDFIQQSLAVILEDAVKKATDVREKVKMSFFSLLCMQLQVLPQLSLCPSVLLSPIQVCEWRSPEQLKELLDLELRDEGESESKTLQRCRDAIRYSVKTSKFNFNEVRSKLRGIS